MKKIRIAILLLPAIVLAFAACQVFAQGVALSRSYEDQNTMRLLAGFGISGTATWSSPGLTRYTNQDAISKTYFENSTGDCTINEWGVPGRWFVSRFNPEKAFAISDTASNGLAGAGLKKAARNTNSLTPIFANRWLEWDSNAKSFIWQGNGISAPAGKFNTIKLRVVNPDNEEAFYFIGDSDTGYWKYSRSYDPAELINGKGKYGAYCEAIWHVSDPNLDVKIVTNVLYDVARFDFQITNLSDTTYNIGLAMTGAANVWETVQECYFDKGDANYGWFQKRGKAFYYMPGVGMATRARTLNAQQMPEKMDIFGYYYAAGAGLNQYGYPQSSDDIVSHAAFYFTGNDATKPDYLTIDDSYHLLGMGTYNRDCIAGFWYDGKDAYHDDGGFPTATVWPEAGASRAAYAPDPTYVFEEYENWPTVYMVTWKATEVAPSKTKQVVTYYGEGDMDFATGFKQGKNFMRNSFITIVDCPSNLSYSADDDTVSPEEFEVTAKVANCSTEKTTFDIKNISFTIDLPEKGEEGYCGLVLADGESATKKYSGYLRKLSNTSVSWRVKVVGDFSGDATFTVTTNGKYIGDPSYDHPELDTDSWTQTVKRTIAIPSTSSGTVDQDWSLMANPFYNPDGDISVDDVFGEGNALLYYWDPVLSGNDKYVQEKLISNMTPGQGYWIGKDKGMKTIDYIYPKGVLPNDINLDDPDYINDRHVTIYKGWNIVGNPYTFPVQWLNCNIRNKRTGDVASITEAVNTYRWMGAALYSWSQEKYGYTVQNSTKAQLLPNTGYWIYAYENLEIIYNPASIPGTSVLIDGTYYPLSLPVESE